jgi:alkylation response protein AidB-like acyl-CoA dehydrogenase
MNFDLSEEQRAIADMATSVFADYCNDDQIRAFWESGKDYDSGLWQQLAETGLLGLTVPEADGGSGLGMVELMLALEQQGRHVAPVPLWRQALAATALAKFARASLNSAWLEKLVAGTALATLSLDGLSASRGLALTAQATGTGWQLDGRAVAVPLAARAQLVLLPAATAEGVRLFIVDPNAAGIEKLTGTLTHAEPAADLIFNQLALGKDALLPVAALPWLEQHALACLAALQLGVASEDLRRTVEYTSQRVQFDRPIASFQVIGARSADCYIDIEALRSTLWQLCWRLDNGLDAEGAARVAKYWACECGHRVSHAASHMHGGMGSDVSYPIHRFLYWSRALELSLGGATADLQALGDWLAQPETVGVEL